MNFGINNKRNVNKHFQFRNMLIWIVVLISFCVQGIYLGYNQYKFQAFSTKIFDDSMDVVHQTMLGNVNDVMEQAETLFTFARTNGLYAYANAHLNLRDEYFVSKQLEGMESLCHEIDLKANLVEGFLVLGKNCNQKSLYYDLKNKQLMECPDLCWDVLSESGLDVEMYQSIGRPVRLLTNDLESVLHHYDKATPEYSALAKFIERCSRHYVMTDMISEVMIITFLDVECFSIGIDGQNNYGFALMSPEAEEIFSYGVESEDLLMATENMDVFGESKNSGGVRKTKVQPEGLWAITVSDDSEMHPHSAMSVLMIGCVIMLNALAFVFVYVFSKKMVEPFKFFERVMLKYPKKDSVKLKVSRKSNSLGKQLIFSLLVSCIVPFVFLILISNRAMDNVGERLMKQYLDACVLQYENASRRFQNDCESLSLSSAKELISEYEINNPYKNMELARNFETNILTKIDTLPNYSYVLVTDDDANILYQSVYSGRPELFSDFMGEVFSDSETSSNTSVFYVMEDAISNEEIIVYRTPVVHDRETIGSILIVMQEPVLNNYAMKQEHTEYLLINKSDGAWSKSQRVNNTDKSEEYLIARCNQSVFENTDMYVRANVEAYIRILDSTLLDSIVIGLILAIVIVFISWLMMRVIMRPIVEMAKGFSNATNYSEKLEINTGVTEINDLIVVYNTMVERQTELSQENERRHENEKTLIALRAQAEFKMLQQQINPHFMFNTLEVINLLASGNGLDEICNVAKALAEILRFSLKHEQTVTVGEEIAALQKYVLIQNIRFGDRIRFETVFNESLFECTMLKFVLQPLVENALTHGVYNKLKDGVVQISLMSQGDNLIFAVSDNGEGMSAEKLAELRASIYDDTKEYIPSTGGGGIGLKNIYRRLRIYYGETANLLIESKLRVGTTVTLVLPIHT